MKRAGEKVAGAAGAALSWLAARTRRRLAATPSHPPAGRPAHLVAAPALGPRPRVGAGLHLWHVPQRQLIVDAWQEGQRAAGRPHRQRCSSVQTAGAPAERHPASPRSGPS